MLSKSRKNENQQLGSGIRGAGDVAKPHPDKVGLAAGGWLMIGAHRQGHQIDLNSGGG
jgi:hypothetical protein